MLRKGSPCYRPWAAKSEKEGHIRCIWCSTEFQVKNATVPKGHEESARHQKFIQEHRAYEEIPKEELKKQGQI